MANAQEMWADLYLSCPQRTCKFFEGKGLDILFWYFSNQDYLITLTDTLWYLDLLKNHGSYDKNQALKSDFKCWPLLGQWPL